MCMIDCSCYFWCVATFFPTITTTIPQLLLLPLRLLHARVEKPRQSIQRERERAQAIVSLRVKTLQNTCCHCIFIQAYRRYS
jgi:hypothetical protein